MKRHSTLKHNNVYDCLIIGAGPGGLSLSYYLKKMSLNYVVLEKGNVGQSWKEMSSCFELITPMWTNSLPSDFGKLNPFKKISCNEYGIYLKKYSKKHRFNIKENEEVTGIRQEHDVIYVKTANNCQYKAKTVVVATGYFSNPNYPEYWIEDTESILHASEFKSVNDLKSKNVSTALIVGKRNTAGQLLVELNNAGIKTSLSMRGELVFRYNEGCYRQLKEFVYFFWEEVLIIIKPDLRQDSFPPMDSKHARKIINEQGIKSYKDIEKIEKNKVFFKDGAVANFDVIIFATGYKPALSFLGEDDEVYKNTNHRADLESNNIFFIGFDNLYNFRSRYIRGMKRDAKKILKKILFSINMV